MTLFTVTKKNIQGNFKNYLIYFLSMIFSVVIYYTFVSLQYSEEIQTSIESWKMMQSVFVQASILLILFVAVFILYSNSFFTKKRKKEVGLYSLLGVRKKTIGKMLFYENMLMGVIAVIIGIFLGTILSKLFAMLLLKLLSSTVDVSFSISITAILNTLLVFAIIILFTSFQAYRLIYRFKLVELFRAEKEGEQAPKASGIAAGMAVVLLGFTYWNVFHSISDEPFIQLTSLLIGMVTGTYLLFRSLIVYLLRGARKNKAYYYRGIRFIGISQLLYRIKGNARTLTMIALLSAVTLCAISVGYGGYYNVENTTNNMSPFSYMYVAADAEFDRQAEELILGDQEHPVQVQLDIPVIQVNGDASDLKYVPYGYEADAVPTRILSASAFDQILAALNRKGNLQLSGMQAAAIRPAQDATASSYVGHKLTIQLPDGTRTVKFVEMVEERVLNRIMPDVYIIVSDSLFAELATQVKPVSYKAYQVEGEKTTKATSTNLMKLAAEKKTEVTGYYTYYTNELQSSGIDIFLLGFLGLVFLAATGSIIYFKQLTEAHEDKDRYAILRKIGVSKREVLGTLAKQILFVFFLPFVIGLLHSLVILKAIFGVDLTEASIFVPVLTAMSAYLVIYIGYYLLTVRNSHNIVNK